MRATLLYGAGDVRVETVPDAEIVEPTDAVINPGDQALPGTTGTGENICPECTSTGRRHAAL